QLRPRTLAAYRATADKLVAWAERVKLRSADDLNRARLMSFREALIAEAKRISKKGAKRGVFVETGERRSPERVNSELRKVRTVLGYLRRLELLPRVTNDDLQDALKRLPVASERIQYLRPHECQKLLEAALRHDAATYTETREEHAGKGRQRIGTTPRYDPIAPFVAFVLLTGCRFGEALALDWTQVELDALDHEGRKVGEVHLKGAATKTHKARTIGLEVSPALHKLLSAVHLASGGKGSVFALSRATAEAAAKRLRAEYGAPASFTWQALRRTCGTYLTNAPGIFGAASAYRSAKQLGHSVQVAERHYVDVARGIPRDARTLEAAMQIDDAMAKLLATASDRAVGGIADLKKTQVAGRIGL
ncbi:MAG TPA: hypothetical protein VFQ35_10615, partial [Polyangiaceae bacterium]|nr:hypothetical protein [Polyangiaceae bacterium]